jgi:hypothetical protein
VTLTATHISRSKWAHYDVGNSWWFDISLERGWLYVCVLGLEVSLTW